jgi:hypothetical protein
MTDTQNTSAATKPVADKKFKVQNRSTHPSAGGGKSAAELVRQSNRWRDNYNPIRGLFIARAVSLLEAADRGDFAELQLVMRKVERRYPVLKGLKARRLAALERLDWEIKVVDELPQGATRQDAEAQRHFLRNRYELVENLTEAIGFLATAEFRGYAILQKHRFNDGGEFDGYNGTERSFAQWGFELLGTQCLRHNLREDVFRATIATASISDDPKKPACSFIAPRIAPHCSLIKNRSTCCSPRSALN